MPQFIEFPSLPDSGVSALIACFSSMPDEGEAFKAFRRRLKDHGLWSRERLDVLLRFMQMAAGDWVVPSAFAKTLKGDAANTAILERLWTVNPLLFSTVVERLTERVHSVNELLKYVDSFAYPGARIPGPHLRTWLRMADGAGLFKAIGIRMGLNEEAQAVFARRLERFDVEEFLEDDADEAPVLPAATPVQTEPVVEDLAQIAPTPSAPVVSAPVVSAPVVSAPVVSAPVAVASPIDLPAPHQVGVLEPADGALDRLVYLPTPQTGALGPAAFGLTPEFFAEEPERAIFELAVAANLRFRVVRPATAFNALRTAGVLEALYRGLPLMGQVQVDATAVMMASLVARRLALKPDLAFEIEQAEDADVVHTLLAAAFEGLFTLEPCWMICALIELQVVRPGEAGAFGALSTRVLATLLFQLGFVVQPGPASEGEPKA